MVVGRQPAGLALERDRRRRHRCPHAGGSPDGWERPRARDCDAMESVPFSFRDRGRIGTRDDRHARPYPIGAAGPGDSCRGMWRRVTESPIASAASGVGRAVLSPRRLILPLALAQFICGFAGSNMNVMITDISHDLDTTVKGVQTAITLFLLIMAILMIPCSKLTDRWGRKRCFIGGLTLYGIGALLSAASPNLGVLILGNSVFEGVGTAFLIPPVYILATLWFRNLTSRAWAFGVISGLGGIGPAANASRGGSGPGPRRGNRRPACPGARRARAGSSGRAQA